MKNNFYPDSFYAARTANTSASSQIVLDIVIDYLKDYKIDSVSDIGCGTGAWLEYFQSINSNIDVTGYEGFWLPLKFQEYLTNKGVSLKLIDFADKNSYAFPIQATSLVICLEVYEHIMPCFQPLFVDQFLINSDVVLFSCAPPYQGGNGHVGETSLSAIVDMFRSKGFSAHDIIRPIIWNNALIPYWYRQNTILFIRGGTDNLPGPLDLIHPDSFKQRAKPSFSQAIYHLSGRLKGYFT